MITVFTISKTDTERICNACELSECRKGADDCPLAQLQRERGRQSWERKQAARSSKGIYLNQATQAQICTTCPLAVCRPWKDRCPLIKAQRELWKQRYAAKKKGKKNHAE